MRPMVAKLFRPFAAALSLALLVPAASHVCAQPQGEAGFQGYLQHLAARARAEGVRESTIVGMTQGLTLNQRVIDLVRAEAPPASAAIPPFAPYRRQHIDATKVANGRRFYRDVEPIAEPIARRYGVPASVMIAIWGHETNYGTFMGNFDLARSLASLAYEGRRRELFEGEFIALLKMVDQGVPPSRLRGSWAGAFGNPQFLPSVYLRLAADGDGDGDRDIWTSRADTLASIANYFRDAGWRTGQPWGVVATVPPGFNRRALETALVSPECPRVYARHTRWRSVREWRALGVEPRAPIGEDVMATLLEPDGPGATAYLLTGNYRVILEYNCSNFYALSVGLLADEIAR
jgi:membrane-bound lytic murein transglycosylase B